MAIFSFSAPSQALCAIDDMGGRWENEDLETSGITTVIYIPRCVDYVVCPTDGPCSTPPGTSIQVFGSCSPTDCDWGESPVQFHQEDNWRYAVYDQEAARKVVWLRIENNGQLTVVEDIDYRDSREDRVSWYRFNKV
ncbi:MAG: hypothetical protein AAGE59_07950 [Cyanobacteria bacterium P01_F01_bin.86]